MKVFAFLNLKDPLVAWAAMRGVLVSADQAPGPYECFPSMMMAGMIECEGRIRIYNELVIEAARVRMSGPTRISRLRGIYFFRSREDAEARRMDPNWPPYFTSENLVELDLTYHEYPSIVDSNWITFASHSDDGRVQSNDTYWENYWRGSAMPKRKPVWEVIANGIAVVVDERIRQQSYELVKQSNIASWVTIEMSRLASEVARMADLLHHYLGVNRVRTRSSYAMFGGVLNLRILK